MTLRRYTAFEIAGVPPHISPHRELIPAAADTLVSLLERRADDRSSRNELPAEYSLPACSDAELDILRIVLNEFNALLELPPMMETVRGLANYSEAQTAWRETIWTRLPPCVSAFASGLLMSQISSDIAWNVPWRLLTWRTLLRPLLAADLGLTWSNSMN